MSKTKYEIMTEVSLGFRRGPESLVGLKGEGAGESVINLVSVQLNWKDSLGIGKG